MAFMTYLFVSSWVGYLLPTVTAMWYSFYHFISPQLSLLSLHSFSTRYGSRWGWWAKGCNVLPERVRASKFRETCPKGYIISLLPPELLARSHDPERQEGVFPQAVTVEAVVEPAREFHLFQAALYHISRISHFLFWMFIVLTFTFIWGIIYIP